ncbi:hypothetical protein M1M06_07325 [Ralstonia insidiosa]|uniref:hypothetical protein n=2 Tax=Pseudomonadota TaxID=1224 RepID=UPI0010FA14D0|nr:hypothetical protein [Ralstonia insidiosa]MCK8648854.1 hypothetical protein [Ralstonia insidiosa]
MTRLANVRAYRIWAQMKGRCTNPNNTSYPRYGGRGITVCERWMTYEGFLADMGHPPAGTTLDRIDNSLGYSPENCRWATWTQQQRNKRSNVFITHAGETLCIAEWAEKSGITSSTLRKRLRDGWAFTDAISLPIEKMHHDKLIEFGGERMGLVQWAERLNLSKGTLKSRLVRGWSLERALTNAKYR